MFLAAAPYVLSGLSALGGIFGKKRKYVDPEMLRKRYGVDAISADAHKLYANILNSPYGQQLMRQAGESGQQLQTNLAANAAASGMGNGSGASSGASDFAAAAAPQAQASMEQGARSNIWQQALPIAQGVNQQLMGVAERGAEYNNNQPSTWERIAGAAGQLASAIPTQRGAVSASARMLDQPVQSEAQKRLGHTFLQEQERF